MINYWLLSFHVIFGTLDVKSHRFSQHFPSYLSHCLVLIFRWGLGPCHGKRDFQSFTLYAQFVNAKNRFFHLVYIYRNAPLMLDYISSVSKMISHARVYLCLQGAVLSRRFSFHKIAFAVRVSHSLMMMALHDYPPLHMHSSPAILFSSFLSFRKTWWVSLLGKGWLIFSKILPASRLKCLLSPLIFILPRSFSLYISKSFSTRSIHINDRRWYGLMILDAKIGRENSRRQYFIGTMHGAARLSYWPTSSPVLIPWCRLLVKANLQPLIMMTDIIMR